MALKNLLNKKCSIRRRVNTGVNSYGENTFSDATIFSDVDCARQVDNQMSSRRLVHGDIGPTNRKMTKYFFLPTDIREGDIIKFEGSETEMVRDVRSGGGRNHHLEILAEDIHEIGIGDGRDE